jgi:TatD DNase family protein
MFFDTHAHLDDPRFKPDQAQVAQNAKDAGLELIVNIGCGLDSIRDTIRLTEQYDWIYGTAGVHPHEAKLMDEEVYFAMKDLAKNPKIVAIGEIGLDFHYDHSPRDVQAQVFRLQIGMARELGLPITIHDREAHQLTLEILDETHAWDLGGIIHCYSGSWQMARQIIKKGYYIAVGGVLTFPNAARIKEVVREIPMDKLLIETDCPYLAPAPYRGKRNEPAYVVRTAEAIAEIKGLPLEEVGRITTENGRKAYRIP